jgi:hypothetical protein
MFKRKIELTKANLIKKLWNEQEIIRVQSAQFIVEFMLLVKKVILSFGKPTTFQQSIDC